jgi:hypothetical protein
MLAFGARGVRGRFVLERGGGSVLGIKCGAGWNKTKAHSQEWLCYSDYSGTARNFHRALR